MKYYEIEYASNSETKTFSCIWNKREDADHFLNYMLSHGFWKSGKVNERELKNEQGKTK